MAKKKPFVLRIDTELLEAIEKWAADEFRSTNGQLEWIIDQAIDYALLLFTASAFYAMLSIMRRSVFMAFSRLHRPP